MADLVQGFYQSQECPDEMIDFNVALGVTAFWVLMAQQNIVQTDENSPGFLGATPEEAKKKATAATIEFIRDSENPTKWMYVVVHGDPPNEYRLSFSFGEAQTTFRSGKQVQAVYSMQNAKPRDSVATVTSVHTGVGNPLYFTFEYNFVQNGFLLICKTGNITAKRWYSRAQKQNIIK